MKSLPVYSLIWCGLTLWSATPIWAQSLHASEERPSSLHPPRQVVEPYLEVYVITPPKPIRWETPKALFKSTLRNGLSLDYAPNGHLAIEIKARRPNAYGVRHVLTGMGRTHKMRTVWDTLYKQYGLTAMIHEFSGDLDSAEFTQGEIQKARKDRRLGSIRVQLTDESADRLMRFLENWISHGSYLRYGGGKNVARGEGSGCSDFAVHFIQLALDHQLPIQNLSEWIQTVYLPWELLQESPLHCTKKKVSPFALLRKNIPWGQCEAEGLKFSIPDPEKIFAWIQARSRYAKRVSIFPEDYAMREILALTPERFDAPYPRQKESTIAEKWKTIALPTR